MEIMLVKGAGHQHDRDERGHDNISDVIHPSPVHATEMTFTKVSNTHRVPDQEVETDNECEGNFVTDVLFKNTEIHDKSNPRAAGLDQHSTR